MQRPRRSAVRGGGVPEGTLNTYTLAPGAIYPGTPHTYQVYVPAQLDPTRSSPFMVFLDGAWIFVDRMDTPAILDRLIANGDLPPLIGIFSDPGVLPVPSKEVQQPRVNRHVEYDSITDRFAQFLLEELLPTVARDHSLSSDPNDRGLVGISSSAVAAFVAAWGRPDQFRRVLSFIGTFVDMLGAHILPFWIRKTEPKPLRIFLQETTGDHDIVYGSWPLANQSVAAALTFAHYDHTLVVGPGEHDLEHARAILPTALQWLWRDYPQPITAATSGPIFDNLLLPDERWEQVGNTFRSAVHPAADRAGVMYCADPASSRIYRITEGGSIEIFREETAGAKSLTFGPDGRLFAIQAARRGIVAYGADGNEETVAEDVDAYALAVTAGSAIFLTDPVRKTIEVIETARWKRTVYDGGEIGAPTALAMSPDQAFLAVLDAESRWGWSFQMGPGNSVSNGQPFFRISGGDPISPGGVKGIAVDTLGELYFPTALGIGVSTQTGRSREIINPPEPGTVSAVAFGGAERDWLYASENGKLFRRRIKRHGAVSWERVKPPAPQL